MFKPSFVVFVVNKAANRLLNFVFPCTFCSIKHVYYVDLKTIVMPLWFWQNMSLHLQFSSNKKTTVR